MSAWGKTGRVTLSEAYEYGTDTTRDVVVDGAPRGRTLAPRGEKSFTGWGAINYDPYGYQDDIPSLDHAVMWVLRRAAPDVWREERGPVVRVEPMWPLAAFSGLTGLARPRRAATRWAVDAPDRRPAETFQSWPDAMKAATS